MKTARILSIWVALLPAVCLACRCGDEVPMQEAVRRCDAVFVGRLTKMEWAMRPEGENFRAVVVCTFSNAEVLKVTVEEKKDMIVVTAPYEASCGYPFHIGDEYLVYASIRRGELETSICDRTRPLEKGTLKKGTDGSSINDFVLDDSGKKEAAAVRAFLKKKPNLK